MADTATMENPVDTSWVTPMGRRAKMLIADYNNEEGDAERKADAAEKIMAVGEALEPMVQAGMPLTEAQKAIIEIYKELKAENPNQ